MSAATEDQGSGPDETPTAEFSGEVEGGEVETPSYLDRLSAPLGELIKVRLRKTGEGGRIGRYLILRLLGEGGMGTVFSAYDEELDRKVAIKLLRTDGPRGRIDRSWLLGEAKAMARLSHPNVVQIYDVGELDDPSCEGAVFIAMELVSGTTLSRWLRERPRGRAAIVDAFVQAGEGLAAVHAAGLIHRDFKPANVLVGDDGRVRVLDFGLAHGAVDPTTRSADGEGSSAHTHAGTPAYMAPEQHLGQEVDARADLFAFGVALHEALHGERPFAGGLAKDVIAAVLASERRPTDAKVPARLRRVIDRALQPEPANRYPSMEALLRDLRSDPWRGRAIALVIAGLALALAITLGLLARGQADEREREAAACAGGVARIAEVWGPSRRDAAAAAFAATALPYADETWSRVQERLDAYAAAWSAADRASCEEHRAGALTDNLFERTSACLDAGRRDLAALARVYAAADAATVERALKASEALPPLERCRDRLALLAGLAPIGDAARSIKVATIREAVASIAAEVEAGHVERCGELEASAAEADALAYRPLVAEVSFTRGRCDEVAGEYERARGHYHRALTTALAGGHDLLAITADVRMSHTIGLWLGELREAVAWVAVAESIADRVEVDDGVRGRMLLTRGSLALRTGRPADARADFERALELVRGRFGERHSSVLIALNNLAIADTQEGREDEAVRRFDALLALSREYLGADHPDTLNVAANLGNALFQRRDYARAEALMIDLVARKTALSGPDHPDIAVVELNLGALYQRLASEGGDPGGFARARDHVARAVEIRERSLGLDNPRTAYALTALGDIHTDLGDHEAAVAHLERALAIYAAGDPDSPDRAYALIRLGRALQGAGRQREALTALDEAARIDALGRSRPDEVAFERYRRAIAIAALRRDREGRREARALAAAALEFYAGDRHAPERREIEAWLATLPDG